MRISFVASPKPAAQEIVRQLVRLHGQSDTRDADCIVAVGGDGTVLRALHATLLEMSGKPVFAMRLDDSVGSLANRLDVAGLPDRLQSARPISLKPLKAAVRDTSGRTNTIYGINEIVLLRQRLQAAKLIVTMNRCEKSARLIGDGVLVSTPIGSSGYNRSAGGPILPLGSSLMVLTGLALLRDSNWANAVIDDTSILDVAVLDPEHRPVRLETNLEEFPNVSEVRISCCHDANMILLFDPDAVDHARLDRRPRQDSPR